MPTRWSLVTVVALLATGCSGPTDLAGDPAPTTTAAAAATTAPDVGACRMLTPADVAAASNDSEPVPCRDRHTAETFLVGEFPDRLADADPDDPRLGAEVFRVCARGFRRFTGADESLALRSILDWAWFRPSDAAWEAGARWFRCDVVGGRPESAQLSTLPRTTKGVLLGIPGDRWITCVAGPSVTAGPPVPCTEPHDWRAATTVVLGDAEDPYPGDRLVEVTSRDFCRTSIVGWMNYPVDYEFAWTTFGEAQWRAGNRRAVCWARIRG